MVFVIVVNQRLIIEDRAWAAVMIVGTCNLSVYILCTQSVLRSVYQTDSDRDLLTPVGVNQVALNTPKYV